MPPITQRLNYFTGLFLQEADFKAEQDYHRDRLRHHNQMLHTPGICEGLDVVAAVGATQIVIQAGSALDRQGQFIILAADRTLTQADIGDNKGKTVLLLIRYQETPVKGEATDELSRMEDRPQLVFMLPAVFNETTTDGIRLAQIEFNPDGSVKSKSDTVRVAAGVNIGSELSVNKLTLRAPTVAANLWPSITSDPNGREIDVNGALSVSGALAVNGNLSFGSQTRQMLNLWGAVYGIGVQSSTTYFRTDANFAWFVKGVHHNDQFNAGAGGSMQMVLSSAGNLGLGTTTEPKDKLHVVGGNIRWGNNSMLFDNQGGSLELGGNNATAGVGTPYIDFHFKDKLEDYNVRLINDADGQLSVTASMFAVSGSVKVDADLLTGRGLTVGPFRTGNEVAGRLTVSGPTGELAIVRRNLAAWPVPPAAPVAGDRYVWYNDNGNELRLWSQTDIFSIDKTGNLNVTSNAAINFASTTRQMMNLWGTAYGIGVQNLTQYFRSDGHFAWYLKGVHHNDTFNAGAGGTPLMVLTNTGNLGLGSTSASFAVDVRGTNGWVGSGDSSQTLGGWRLGRWPTQVANIWLYLTRADSAAYQDLAVGALWAGDATRFGVASDLAEMTPVKAEDNLEAGDVVIIDEPPDDRVLLSRSQKAYDPKVAGVVSDIASAGLIIGGAHTTALDSSDIKPIALAGRVVTKVSLENGSIAAGDFLASSSTPGYAMKATEPGYAIGKALQSFNGGETNESVGKIWIFVNLTWFDGKVS